MLLSDKTPPCKGWRVDSDWWHWRKVRPGDPDPKAFASSCHAFIEAGKLYCRDAEQAEILDGGAIPPN